MSAKQSMVPADFGAELILASSSGEFDLNLDGFDISDFEFDGVSLRATLGDARAAGPTGSAGGEITVQVVNGQISFEALGSQ